VVAVIALFYGVGYWNTWFNALLFLPSNEKWPLQQVLYTYAYRGNRSCWCTRSSSGTSPRACCSAPSKAERVLPEFRS
jgi:multiple sugar transport system permease protein/putative aldouronate transport system permease protein